MQSVIQILLNNLYLIGVLALTTMGIALTFKTANTANFAQSITSTAGAFVAAWLFMKTGFGPWWSIIGGVAVCFLLGWIIDALIVRPATKTNESGRVMITLGLIIIISAFLPLIFGMIPYEYTRLFPGNLDFEMFGAQYTITKNGLFTFCLSVVVIGALFAALNLTKWGLGVRATASNKTVASMMGVNTNSMTAISWAVSSACGALGAVLYASQTTNVIIDMLATIQTSSLLAFVLGGFTSFYGPVIGAILIPIVTSLLALISGLWANVFLYAFVLLVILWRPAGLFGKDAIKKV